MRRLVACDLGVAAEGESDLVEPVEQHLARERVDGEVEPQPARVTQLAGLEVDGQLTVGGERACQLGERLVGEFERQQSGLERVLVEDVAEARRDHDPEPGVLERPGGVLARGAAAEVAPGEQDRGARVLGLAQLKSGSFIHS